MSRAKVDQLIEECNKLDEINFEKEYSNLEYYISLLETEINREQNLFEEENLTGEKKDLTNIFNLYDAKTNKILLQLGTLNSFLDMDTLDMSIDKIEEEIERDEEIAKYVQKNSKLIEYSLNIRKIYTQLENLLKTYTDTYKRHILGYYFTKFAHNVSRIQFHSKKVEILLQKCKLFRDNIKTKINFERRTKGAEEDLKTSEKKLIHHSLTFMSILAAVIAIISSVITMTTTWLNNANGQMAMLAFIIPSLVIMISMITLLSFSGFLYPGGKKRQWTSCIVFLILTGCVLYFSIWHLPNLLSAADYNSRQHTRHIITENMYEIKTDTTGKTCFEFKFEDIIYSIEYDKLKIHDGNLYFCEEHKTLE